DQVLFAPGEADFTSERGRELALHELAHVAQGAGAAAPAAGDTLPIDRDAGRERDADDAAARALAGLHAAPVLAPDPSPGVAAKLGLVQSGGPPRDLSAEQVRKVLSG